MFCHVWIVAFVLAALTAEAFADDVPEPQIVPGKPAASSKIQLRAQSDDSDTEVAEPVNRNRLPRSASERRAAGGSTAPAKDEERLTPLERKSQKRGPPELLAESMATPPEKEFDGVALGLTAVLKRIQGGPPRQQAIEAYWRLAAAQAEFVWLEELREQLRQATKGETNSAAAHSARASLRSAMIRAVTSAYEYQHELAELMKLQADEPLPLAADRPHVGSYNTQFDKLLSRGAPAARLRLLDRLLPIRREAIDLHGAAVVAAEDALNASIQGYETTSTISHLLSAFDQLAWEQRQFLRSVRNYNIEIAEYLLAVMPESTDAETLVKALLTNPVKDRARTSDDDEQARAPRWSGHGSLVAIASERPAVGPIDRAGIGPFVAAVRRGRGIPYMLVAAETDSLYEPLLAAKPPERTQQLSDLLHSHELLPEKLGRASKLSQCLEAAPAAERLTVVMAYWNTRESSARFQAFRNELDQLEKLRTLAMAARHEAGGEKALLDQRAALASARADLMDEEAVFVEEQFSLTLALRLPLDRDWILPITPPQAGGYASAAHGDSNSLRRRWLSRTIAAHYEELKELSAAVVYADDDRASAVRPRLQSGQNHVAVERAVWAVRTQTDLTLDFLRCARRYNAAIAEYAIDVLGPNVSRATLLKALVLPTDDA